MTKEELRKIGIHHYVGQVYYFDMLEEDVVLPTEVHIEYILEKVFNVGFERGVERGKQDKVKEIRNLLQIDDNG